MGSAPLISVEEALTAIAQHAPAPQIETLDLADCLGRRLAREVNAQTTLPPADVSAMDGYAVRLSDTEQADTRLNIIGDAPAGTPFDGAIQSGEAVRIFTGAIMPSGANHIVIQENTTRQGNQVIIHPAQTEIRHVRKEGLDFATGQTVLCAETKLGPAEIAVAAAANIARLTCVRRPKVALLACGDELRPPGSHLEKGQIVNSNAYALSALLRQWGAEPIDMGILPDDPNAIRTTIRQVSEADLMVPVGGASVGDHDHMRRAFQDEGSEMIFEKIAVKPGKPTWLAKLNHQTVLGLPGNPASAYVCAHLFLRPLLGFQSPPSAVSLKTTTDLPANGPRETYLRARSGHGTVTVLPQQDSSLLTPFLTADVLLRRESHAPALQSGDVVKCVPMTGAL